MMGLELNVEFTSSDPGVLRYRYVEESDLPVGREVEKQRGQGDSQWTPGSSGPLDDLRSRAVVAC